MYSRASCEKCEAQKPQATCCPTRLVGLTCRLTDRSDAQAIVSTCIAQARIGASRFTEAVALAGQILFLLKPRAGSGPGRPPAFAPTGFAITSAVGPERVQLMPLIDDSSPNEEEEDEEAATTKERGSHFNYARTADAEKVWKQSKEEPQKEKKKSSERGSESTLRRRARSGSVRNSTRREAPLTSASSFH